MTYVLHLCMAGVRAEPWCPGSVVTLAALDTLANLRRHPPFTMPCTGRDPRRPAGTCRPRAGRKFLPSPAAACAGSMHACVSVPARVFGESVVQRAGHLTSTAPHHGLCMLLVQSSSYQFTSFSCIINRNKQYELYLFNY